MMRFYPIKEHPYYGIYPGKLANDEVAIAFSGYPGVTIVHFYAAGEMKNVTQHPPFISKTLHRSDDTSVVERERDYLRSLGFKTFERVVVQAFSAESTIYIEEFPSHLYPVLPDQEKAYEGLKTLFQDLYDDWETALADEIVELKVELNEWVLWHGNDYWVDSEGNITDS